MSSPAAPGKAANGSHYLLSSSASTSASASPSSSHPFNPLSHTRSHQSSSYRPPPSSGTQKLPSSVYSQLQNLHLEHVSSSSLASTSSASGMLEDDDSGDIALSLPRSRSDRLLANNLQRSISRPSSTSPGIPGSPSGYKSPIPSALGRSTTHTSSAPTSPLRDNTEHRSLSSSMGGRSYMSRGTPFGSTSTTQADRRLGSPTRPSATLQPPETPPRVPTVVTSDAPEQLASPIQRRRKHSRPHSTSLSVNIPSADVAHRLGVSTSVAHCSDLANDEGPTASPRPPPLVDDETARQMARWVKEIVVCNFDLERGPVVERRVIGRRWGPGLKENVAFSSFPDTSLFTEGSIQFSFKVRDVPPSAASLAYPEPPSPRPESAGGPVLKHTRGNSLSREKEAEYRVWDERGREWLYGYVWFQQKKDRGIARGFMQKSVVVLTHLPLPAFFSQVLARVAPAFFEHGYTAIEVACHSIASWPDPEPDALLELPLLTDVLTVKLPDKTENPQVQLSMPGVSPILAALPASTPLRAFATFLPSLWSIWECLVLAEPLLIIAPDPKTCSEVVWWLRELVRPLPLAGDFRPYLHIHDHDFSLLVNANKPQAGVVVGVTNPFFRNAASHWPNVISIPGATKAKTPGLPKQDVPEGFLSRRSRSVSKDRPLLKRLELLVAAGRLDDPEGNAALRTHFQQLTERMLVPLNRYFQTLVPPRSPHPSTPGQTPQTPNLHLGQLQFQLQHPRPQRGGTPFSPMVVNGNLTPVLPPSPALSIQTLKPFSLPTFLQHLRNHGPNPLSFKARGITSKSRIESDFYATFCKSSTFAGWLSARVESLGIAVASNMLEDAIAAAAAVRISPDPFAIERRSERSSTEASGTSGTTASTTASFSPGSDNDDEAETPRPKDAPDSPFSTGRFRKEQHLETMTPTACGRI